jgi:inner membrane protein
MALAYSYESDVAIPLGRSRFCYDRDMTARTHDLAAITALLGIVLLWQPLPTLSLGTVLVAIVANQLGGIAPDLDQPTAPFWRNLPIGGVVGKVIDKLLGGHRFVTHSLVGVALFGYLLHLLLQFIHPIIPGIDVNLVWWAFMVGMVSHLIMDTFTKEGVPWLLPIPFKFGLPPVKSLRVTTGKAVEHFVVIPVLLAADVWLCASHYQLLLALVHHHVT